MCQLASITLITLCGIPLHGTEMPPRTPVELVIPPANTNHSAYRLDAEVFGWNKDFSEVAAVGVETIRGRGGGHRGEANLLVYEVGKTLPLHVVIAHTITHADLPHEPVPIEDARDLTWAIEDSFLGMWPHRPKHRLPSGGMGVEAISEVEPVGNSLCTPQVGFILTYQGQRRFQPFAPLDMHVRCANLAQTDSRTYWGSREVAAVMIRYDFAASHHNEESARFVVSAAWRLGRALQAELVTEVAPAPGVATSARRLLQRFASVRGSVQSGNGPGHGQVVAVAVKPDLRLLGQHLARFWHLPAPTLLDPKDPLDIRVRIAAGSAAPVARPQPPRLTPADDAAPGVMSTATSLAAPPKMAAAVGSQSTMSATSALPAGAAMSAAATPARRGAGTASRYLSGWKIR